MGQCGCGDFSPTAVYAVKGCDVAVEVFNGCRDCDAPIALRVNFFTKRAPFMRGSMVERVTPDEFGAGLPRIPIFHLDDLRQAFREAAPFDPTDEDNYETIDDYLADHGLRIVQRAMEICAERGEG